MNRFKVIVATGLIVVGLSVGGAFAISGNYPSNRIIVATQPKPVDVVAQPRKPLALPSGGAVADAITKVQQLFTTSQTPSTLTAPPQVAGISDDKSGTVASDSAKPVEVDIIHDNFSTGIVTINVGDTIKWINKDQRKCTITDINGSFDSGEIGAGAVYFHRFDKSGLYNYKCTLYPSMIGKVIVH